MGLTSELPSLAKPVLVDAVKFAQRQHLQGPQGGWKEFLEAKQDAVSGTNPARRESGVLVEFLSGALRRRAPPASGAQQPDGAADAAAEQTRQRKLLRRFLRWRRTLHEVRPPRVPASGDASGDAAAAAARGVVTPPACRGVRRSLSGVPPTAGSSVLRARGGRASQEQAALARRPSSAPSPSPSSTTPAWEDAVSEAVAELVRRTQAHPDYRRHFSFPSWERGWRRTPRVAPAAGGASTEAAVAAAAAPPRRLRLLGVDCEMCATERDTAALLGVCVVDADGNQILKELVVPSGGRVLDFRTPLTGITPASLEGVTQRRGAVVAKLAALLDPCTVLVGHSLHNDLAALKLDHAPVVDTSLLFSYRGLAHCKPSLADLASAVLRTRIRDGSGGTHDSREDAVTALALAVHEAAHGPTPPLEPPFVKVPKEELRRMLVHRIPSGATSAHIAAAFEGAGAPLEALEGDPASGKATAVFRDPGVANRAFQALEGAAARDSMGRSTKTVTLPGTTHKVKVRLMGAHNGSLFGTDQRRDRVKRGGGAWKAPGAAAAAASPGGAARTAPGKKLRPGKAQREAAKAAAAAAVAAAGGVATGAAGGASPEQQQQKQQTQQQPSKRPRPAASLAGGQPQPAGSRPPKKKRSAD